MASGDPTWIPHVNALQSTGKVTNCAIHGLPDCAVWATTAGFMATQAEVKNLAACIADEKRAAFLPQDGVVVNQTKYTYLRHDPGNSIYAATGTTGGVCILKTTRTVVIATYKAPLSFHDCITEVSKLAEYLVSHQL